MNNTAKIFWSGRSQAVRLPKVFRFDVETVHVRREGNSVILEPIAEDWAWLSTASGKLDQDFIRSTKERPKQQKRPALDRLFK